MNETISQLMELKDEVRERYEVSPTEDNKRDYIALDRAIEELQYSRNIKKSLYAILLLSVVINIIINILFS